MKEERASPEALVQLGLAVVLLGAGWPVTKSAQMHGASTVWFALGRAGLSALVSAAAVWAAGRARLPGRADVPAVLALGLLQVGSFFVFAHLAVAWVPAGRTAILSNAALIWTVPIALVSGAERISAWRWAAAGLGLAGVVAMVGPWAVDWGSWRALAGNGFLLCASLSWALAMVATRRWPPRSSLFALMPWVFALATLELLPLALLHDPGAWSLTALAELLVIGLVAAPLGTWCVAQATVALPLVVASVGFLLGPVVGLGLSVAWLGETLTGATVAGTALILGGAGLAAWSARA